jgi:hypothetical protein
MRITKNIVSFFAIIILQLNFINISASDFPKEALGVSRIAFSEKLNSAFSNTCFKEKEVSSSEIKKIWSLC